MELCGTPRILLFCILIVCVSCGFLPPLITEWHDDKTTVEGTSVKFACKASGEPKPRMKWKKNGVDLIDSKILKNGNIDIRSVTSADEGQYTCRAESTLGFTEKSASLVVRERTRITSSPLDLILPIGKNAVFHCTASSDPLLPLTFEWLHNGEAIDYNAGSRLVHHADNSLTIAHVQLVDNGTYICLAKTELDEVTSEGHLNVVERILVNVYPMENKISAGSTSFFTCNATSKFPLPVTIKWLHNGENIDFSPESRFLQTTNNSLQITNVRDLDAGTYTCLAKTAVDEVTAEVQLTYGDIPNPPRILSVTCKGREATITWESAGDNNSPILEYNGMVHSSNSPLVWSSFSDNLPATANTTTYFMNELGSTYTFAMIATNGIGHSHRSSSSHTCQTDSDVPHINPSRVKGKGGENNTLVISWNIMYRHEHHGPGFKYRVYWRRDAPGENWKATNITDWEKTEYVVRNVTMYQKYRIKVAAVNDLGPANVPATEFIVYSGEDVPTQSPTNLIAVEIIDSTRALISWDPVPPETVHGHLLGYKIQIWTDKSGEKGMKESEVYDGTSNKLISQLFPYSKNYVRVVAYNSQYDSPASNIVIINTPDGVPEFVHKFEAHSMGSTALFLQWEPPQEINGQLTGYKITCTPSTQPRLTKEITITNPYKEYIKISDLTPSTEYRLGIAAVTRGGEGHIYQIYSSTKSKFTAPPDTPKFEWYQQPVVNSAARVRVVWKPNSIGNLGSHFYVKYREKGEKKVHKTLPELTELSMVVKGLALNKVYDFKVVAVDGEFKTESLAQDVDTFPFSRAPLFLERFPGHKIDQLDHNMSLKCVATGDLPLTFVWLVDGVPVPNNTRFFTDQYFTSDGDVASHMNIFNIDVREGGEYSCTAVNHVLNVTHRARVDVKGDPFIRVMPDIFADAGSAVVLKCSPTGYPIETIVWKRGGESLLGNQRRTVYRNGTMIIDHIRQGDAGTYKCVVGGKDGFITTRDVNVHVREPAPEENLVISEHEIGENTKQ